MAVLSVCHFAYGQVIRQNTITIGGNVVTATGRPLEYAQINLPDNEVWATTNEKGAFVLRDIPAGEIKIVTDLLGYAKSTIELTSDSDIHNFKIILQEDNLRLADVEVTAQAGKSLTTSYVIDRTALDHLQMIGVADAMSLLPGGKTNTEENLALGSQVLSVNGQSGEIGNAAFGVGVEVDGVRLSNNGYTGDGTAGIDTRNIASTNVESMEVVTGVPSVEYSDVTDGIVKINTRKGASKYIVDMLAQPNTKQLAVSKGFSLGEENGVLNLSIEHTKSISDLASPYTDYERNALSLNYMNTFNKKYSHPVLFNFGITGNIGGYDSKNDPDLFSNTYTKENDNVLRSNVSAKWLLKKSWITNIEFSGGFNYNDQLEKDNTYSSSSASVAALHTMEEGYHIGQTYDQNPDAPIILIDPGYRYVLKYNDNKLVNYNAKLKANWSRKFGTVNNQVMVGAEFSGSGNKGKGVYYADMRYAPTWRPYDFSKIPFNYNYALYAEDKVFVPFKESDLELTAGVRSDITSISGSVYGTVGNLSPRLNAKYTFWRNRNKFVRTVSLKYGWGKMVKLPSLSVLYPQPKYSDQITFAPGTTSQGQTFYAYYTYPSVPVYNPALKWQSDIQNEIGIEADIDGTQVSLTFQQDKTNNPFSSLNVYTPYTYKFTDQSVLENSTIPISDRAYTVDKNTGVVTVSDNTGKLPAEQLSYTNYLKGQSNSQPINGDPVVRRTIRWIIDFRQIEPIKTSFRIDGNYYYYKGLSNTLQPSLPSSNVMSDGNPYKYIGYYIGGSSSADGSISKSLNINFTSITHIPSVGMIFTIRLESTFYDFSRNLSEYANGAQRGFVVDDKNSYLPSATQSNIYGGNRFVGYYPQYYVSLDDMNTKIPFEQKFLWAKQNDPTLYNDLSKLVIRSNNDYFFNPISLSAYYNANIAVTKEIGKIASITFSATNFFNNTALIRSTQNNASVTLFDGSYIPKFYYGLSLRLKL